MKPFAYKADNGSVFLLHGMDDEQVSTLKQSFPSVKDFFPGDIAKGVHNPLNGLQELQKMTVDLQKVAEDQIAQFVKVKYNGDWTAASADPEFNGFYNTIEKVKSQDAGNNEYSDGELKSWLDKAKNKNEYEAAAIEMRRRGITVPPFMKP